MPTYVVVSRTYHSASRWRRPKDYEFARHEAVVSIVGGEAARAALSMPLVFVAGPGGFQLSVMLSLTPGTNLFVAPDGRWLEGYIPAFFRAYPFKLMMPQSGKELVLCIDKDSGLIVDGSIDGEPFFDPSGEPAPALKTVLNFLSELERSRVGTELAIASLEQAGLIVPWPIVMKGEQGEKKTEGLYRIDEAALNALPNEEFLKLRATGALPVAYAQLMSMSQLGVLERLARLQAQLAPKPIEALPDTLDKLFDSSDNLEIRFD